MQGYQVAGPARVCAQSGVELKPGMRIRSVLIDENGAFLRKDYALSAWQGPPPGALAWWTGQIPPADRPAKPIIHEELLLDCFHRLHDATEEHQQHFRYVVALLLMRRKRLRFEDTKRFGEREFLVVRDSKTATKYEIADPRLTDEQMARVQEEVFRVLGWE